MSISYYSLRWTKDSAHAIKTKKTYPIAQKSFLGLAPWIVHALHFDRGGKPTCSSSAHPDLFVVSFPWCRCCWLSRICARICEFIWDYYSERAKESPWQHWKSKPDIVSINHWTIGIIASRRGNGGGDDMKENVMSNKFNPLQQRSW